MNEEKDAPNQHREARSIETPSVKPPFQPPIQPPRDPELIPPHEGGKGNERTEKMSTTDRVMMWATIVIAAGTLVSAAAIVLQWREMVGGGADTTKIANAADKIKESAGDVADAAGNQADAAQQFSDTAEDINGRMSAAVDQLSATAENTKTTISNAEKAFRAEQRAWVGVAGTSDIKGLTETEPWQITVVFFNSGRTPARNVQTSGMYTTSPIPLSGPSPEQIAMLDFRPAQSIAPQGYYREVIGSVPGAESATIRQISGQQVLISQYMQIKNKQLFLYYYGLLKYDDTFGKPHETQFCVLLANPDTKEAGMCDSFNDLK